MSLSATSPELTSKLSSEESDEELIEALGSRSRTIGSGAWGKLAKLGKYALVARALREGRFTRRDGRVRALNLLCLRGRHIPEAFDVYLRYAAHPCRDTASCALFGLAFWQDRRAIPHLQRVYDETHSERVQLALRSLSLGDPKIYSPGFRDAQGVWSIPEERTLTTITQ